MTRFTRAERRLIARLRTPRAVQRYLNRFPYNNEPHGRATLRSFRGVVAHGCAHCLEAALFAAVVLEQHGYPPLVLSFESIDELDHVIFVYRQRGRWGSVARSRDPGLHGRKPVFATPRALALSYFDPYIDFTGRVTGYAVVDVAREMGTYDWRLAETNVWKVERMLLDYPHRRIVIVGCARRRGCAPDIAAFRTKAWRAQAACSIRGASGGRRCRRSSVQVEISSGFRDRFLVGLLQRFLEAPRQGVAARLLGIDRLLKHGLAPSRFLGENPVRVAQFGLVPALGFAVGHHAPEIGVDDEHRLAAGARHLDFGFEPRRHSFLLFAFEHADAGKAGEAAALEIHPDIHGLTAWAASPTAGDP